MTEDPGASLVPYYQAAPQTQAAYQAGLQRLRDLNALPDTWTCSICGATTQGKDILISYIGDTAIPYCPTKGCPAHGSDLHPGGDAPLPGGRRLRSEL
jgi:hypothetical protein